MPELNDPGLDELRDNPSRSTVVVDNAAPRSSAGFDTPATFARLNRALAELPRARTTGVVPTAFPIPRDECIAKNLTVPCGPS